MILIELTAAIDAAGTLRTFYLSDVGFVTNPSDTPANQDFMPRLVDPGSIGIHAFSDGRTGGATKLETGEIVLTNADGALDGWKDFSFDGRPVVIRYGAGGAYPTTFTTLFTGTVDSVLVSWKQVVVQIKDKQAVFDRPARTAVYGGTNVLPNGVDGTASDIKGKVRPCAYGKVLNVAPPNVNTSQYVFEVGPCVSVDAVYVNGASLTAGAVYTSLADLQANAPTAGQFRAWPAGGYFRLGTLAGEQVTADVTEGATAADRTTAQLIKRIALAAGLGAGEISTADVAALDAAASAVVGIWIEGDTTFAASLDQVAASAGAWYGFDAGGVLRMGQLAEPTGAPARTLHDYDIQAGIERRPPKDTGTPAWSYTLNHTKNWTVQASGLAGAVTTARAAFLAQGTRASTAQDASIKTQWLLAESITADSLLTTSTDADAEAARRLALYKVRRDVFDMPIHLDVLRGVPLQLMEVTALQLPRFGMASGRNFRLIGIALELARSRITLTLWG